MFYYIRKIASNPVIASFLNLSLLLFSCQDSLGTREDIIANKFTGQELFKGIFFGQGSVVERLPSLSARPKIESIISKESNLYHEYIALQDFVIKYIEDTDAPFFERFRASMQGGNHLLIQESIIQASEKYKQAFTEISGFSADELKIKASELISEFQLINKDGTYSATNLKAAIAKLGGGNQVGGRDNCIAVVVVLVAVLAEVYIYAFLWVYAAIYTEVLAYTIIERTKGSSSGSLFKDQLVHEIATQLKSNDR